MGRLTIRKLVLREDITDDTFVIKGGGTIFSHLKVYINVVKYTKICSNPNCIHCGVEQPLSNFYKDKSIKCGYRSRCKDCCREYDAINKRNTSKQPPAEKICSNPNCKHAGKLQPINNFTKSAKTKTGYRSLCETCEKEYRLKNKEFLNFELRKYNASNATIYYYEQLKKYYHEDIRIDGDTFQVKCANNTCSQWFTPTVSQARHRLESINTGIYENHMYCSDKCKISCPRYKQKSYLVDHESTNLNYLIRLNILQNELSSMCFELDNYTCQYCGANKNNNQDIILEAHHITPVFLDIMCASDIYLTHKYDLNVKRNIITLCSDCHNKIHRKNNCNGHFLHKYQYDYELLSKMMIL